MYVEPKKMVQMNRFAEQKLRHRCREQTYGHQGGKGGGGGGMIGRLGLIYNTNMYKMNN